MKLSASVYAGDRSVWTARANKTVHKLSTLPINKTKSVSLASVFLHILFPNTEVCISLVLSLSLSLPFGDLFAACLEAMARKVYCGAELKSELNYVLLVRTDYQKRTEQQKKKKSSTSNGALGYLWFSTKWWEELEILTLQSPSAK